MTHEGRGLSARRVKRLWLRLRHFHHRHALDDAVRRHPASGRGR